jgi:pimeloyl-ACP methyl ester carboxylesterase
MAAADGHDGRAVVRTRLGRRSWYLVATDDHMIPPAAQRAMSERAKATVTETPGSHAVFVSRPAVVAAVISQAAQGPNDQP